MKVVIRVLSDYALTNTSDMIEWGPMQFCQSVPQHRQNIWHWLTFPWLSMQDCHVLPGLISKMGMIIRRKTHVHNQDKSDPCPRPSGQKPESYKFPYYAYALHLPDITMPTMPYYTLLTIPARSPCNRPTSW